MKNSPLKNSPFMPSPSAQGRINRRRVIRAGAALSVSLIVGWPLRARAQSTYPDRPVRVIVPFPAGQGTDVATRHLTEQLSKALGHNFYVDNRPGAAARVGIELLAKAKPDGYTLGVGTAGTQTINREKWGRIIRAANIQAE